MSFHEREAVGVLNKMLMVFFICITILLSGCSEPKSSTTSYIKIVDKGITDEQYWVEAIDPYSKQQREFNLTIEQMNTWNLVEVESEYLATYEYTSLEKGAGLVSIKHPSKANE